ncbi:MAG TPA: hypothetical protein VMS08_05480 [Candidatus Saccharimonadia bacterium]|nr:hypothetical protein [Candidatus Saccharimonadia bacterium]
MSGQTTPEEFTDIPAVYQKVLDGVNDYNDFDVNVGSVHLTQPPQLNGRQEYLISRAH